MPETYPDTFTIIFLSYPDECIDKLLSKYLSVRVAGEELGRYGKRF